MEDDDDVHRCLSCNMTIHGLVNYIQHKKTECAGKKTPKKTPVPTFLSSASLTTQNPALQPNTAQLPSTAQSVSTFFIPGTYANSQHVEISTGSLLPEQSTFLHTDHTLTVSVQAYQDRNNFPKLCTLSTTANVNELTISLPADVSNPTTDSTQLTYSLSPVFSTSEYNSVDKPSIEAITSLSEDHGIMNAIINGVRVKEKNSKPEIQTTFTGFDDAEFTSKKEDNARKEEVIDDFFQSLELMSKTDPRADKGSSFNQLPISNILNNLTFSSDEEDLSFSFAEDVSFDSLTEGSGDEMAPPKHHTGGKWRPGEKPTAYRKARQHYQGKWPPSQQPSTTRRHHGPSPRGKNIELIRKQLEGVSKPKSRGRSQRKSKRSSSNAGSKTLFCTFCNLTFDNRFKYSNHCGTPAHKAKVFNTSQTSENEVINKDSERAFVGGVHEKEIVDSVSEKEVSEARTESITEEKQNTDDISKETTVEEVTNQEPDDTDTANESKKQSDEKTANENDSRTIQQEYIDENSGQITQGKEGKHSQDKANDNDGIEKTKDAFESETECESNAGDDEADDNDVVVDDEKNDDETDKITTKQQQQSDDPLRLLTVHICTVCDKKLPNKYLVAKHLLTKYHKNRSVVRPKEHFEMIQKYNSCIIRLSPYQCGICKFYYNSYDEFKQHVQSGDHANACEGLTGEMQCTLCKFESHEQKALQEHLISDDHVKAIEKKEKICIWKERRLKSTCKYCGLEMKSYSRLNLHIQLKHKDCLKVTGVKRRVNGVRNCPECPICKKQCLSNSVLKLHYTRHHAKEKNYHCDVCNKSFLDKYTLDRHRKSELHVKLLAKIKKEKADGTIDLEEDGQQKQSKENDGENEADMFIEAANKAMGVTEKQTQLEAGSDNEETHKVDDDDDDDDEDYEPPKKKQYKLQTKKFNQCKKERKTTYKCDYCDFTARTYDGLRPHYMEKHSSVIKTCEPCDMIFLSEKAYKLHWNSQEHQKNIGAVTEDAGAQLYECHICHKKYANENYKNFHTAYSHLHATTEAAALKENGGKSITLDKYKDFLDSVRKINFDTRVNCPDCNAAIKKSNLMVHLRTHTDERLFKCKICSKAFLASYTLRKHILQHFGCTERTCDICGKDFKKISAFQKHMQLHRAEQSSIGKTFICETCGMDFYLESQLKRHVLRHNEKKFKCPFPGCLWKFVQQGELNSHYKCHEVEKKFLCATCGFAAHTPYHLKRHNKTHTGERKFHCDYCDYKAGNNTHLQRHMRIHIGAKPYQCPYCSYACNTHENMRKHIMETKKHKGKFMYPCKFCDFGTNSSKDFRFHLENSHEDLIGQDFREPALTAFTGVYNRALDPKQPQEGKQIIQLKERKQTRRKKSVDVVEVMETEVAEVSNVKPEPTPPQSQSKRKSRRPDRKVDNFEVIGEFVPTREPDNKIPTLVSVGMNEMPISLIVKNSRAYTPVTHLFPASDKVRPDGNHIYVQNQIPEIAYAGQSGYYTTEGEGLERYITVESKPTEEVLLHFNP